jgi:hypothetical protein
MLKTLGMPRPAVRKQVYNALANGSPLIDSKEIVAVPLTAAQACSIAQ